MKIKLSAAITLIAVIGACSLTAACDLRESKASDASSHSIKGSAGPGPTMYAFSPIVPRAESVPDARTAPAAAAVSMSTNEALQHTPNDLSELQGSAASALIAADTAKPPGNDSYGASSNTAPAPDSAPASSVSAPAPVSAPASSGASEPTAAPPTASVIPNAPESTAPANEKPEEAQEVSVPVLNYHSIGVDPDSTLILDPDKFARQMEYLAKEGFTPLSLSDFTLILEKRKPPPPKPILLTFDDGYSDNYTQAMPVLKQYGFSVTLFMSPGVLGQDGYLTWEQVKEMHKAGWDIQPHGMTHPHLPSLTAAKQKEEITEARRQIEEQLGTTADVFCYPYGEFNKQTLAILKEEGFRYAFTIQQGMTSSSQQSLQLKRIYVNARESISSWSNKLAD